MMQKMWVWVCLCWKQFMALARKWFQNLERIFHTQLSVYEMRDQFIRVEIWKDIESVFDYAWMVYEFKIHRFKRCWTNLRIFSIPFD